MRPTSRVFRTFVIARGRTKARALGDWGSEHRRDVISRCATRATLHMRVLPAPGMGELGEPLFGVGAHDRSSIVVLREAPGGYRFNYDNDEVAIVESAVVPHSPHGYRVEIERPNFRPEKYGVEDTGDVVIRVDGREVRRTQQVAFEFPWDAEAIGSNPFGTMCAAEFRGWVFDVRFVPRK